MYFSTFFKYFFGALFLGYAILAWSPQYFHRQFTPININYAMPEQEMDFYGVYASAREWLKGKSARFLAPGDGPEVYKYSIGGIFHPYGPITILAVAPLTKVHFSKLIGIIAPLFIFLCGLFVYLILSSTTLAKNSKISLVILSSSIVVMSGPINMLIERGNWEIFIPFLLFPFYRAYVKGNLSHRQAFLLGIAINIKTWPIFLACLLLEKAKLKLLLTTAATTVFFHLVFHPIFPVDETFRAMNAFADASAESLAGVSNFSLHSLTYVLSLKTGWRTISGILLILNGLFVLYLFYIKKLKTDGKDGGQIRMSLFAFCLVVALISPAMSVLYMLLAALILFQYMDAVAANKKLNALLMALVLLPLNILGRFDGPMKTICLIFISILAVSSILRLNKLDNAARSNS